MIQWWWLLVPIAAAFYVGGYYASKCYRAGLWAGVVSPETSVKYLRERGWKV